MDRTGEGMKLDDVDREDLEVGVGVGVGVDIDGVRKLVREGDRNAIQRAYGAIKGRLDKLTGKLPQGVREALRAYELVGDWESGKTLLAAMVKERVGPKRIDVTLVEKLMRVGTAETKELIDAIGHKIAANCFTHCMELAGTDPQVIIRFERGNPRIGLRSDRLSLGIELHFRSSELEVDRWRVVGGEFEKLLGSIRLSGSQRWYGVRVRASRISAGMCVLSAWHEFNHPMFCIFVKHLFKREGARLRAEELKRKHGGWIK